MLSESIVIIGAGASGVAAAAKLKENGFQNVTILEAKNRIGGRINTVNFADNIVELGAQWVHGEENIVFDLASKNNLIASQKFHSFNFFTSDGKRLPEDESDKIISLYSEIESNSDILKTSNKSYGEVFTKEFYRRCQKEKIANEESLKQYLTWIFKLDRAIQGCDSSFDISAKRLNEYKNCPGDLLINWKTNGFKALMNFFVSDESKSDNKVTKDQIHLEKQVELIDYKTGSEVIISTRDGFKYKASHVIFTPSLGVLKERHSSLFRPLLSNKKIRAIENLGIGVVNKIFLEFPDRWWPLEMQRLCLLWTKEDEEEFVAIYGENYKWLLDVYYFMSLPNQPRVLCAWISGPLSKYPETLTDKDVVKQTYILLQRFFGKMFTVSQPINMIRSNWYTDQCFRGCYSHRTLETEKSGVTSQDLAEPVLNDLGKPVILFAGEATHDYYFSTVHGAIESGFREANRIINYYKIHSQLNGVMDKMSSLNVEESVGLVIVGAGIAGLAAAKTLEKAGYKDYILLEAQNKIGGRINSVSYNSTYLELGAQFLHGNQSDLAYYCQERDLLSDHQSSEGEGLFVRDDGTELDARLIKEIKDVVEHTLAECEGYATNEIISRSYIEPNIGKLLRTRFSKYLKMKDYDDTTNDKLEDIFDWHVRFLVIDNACLKLNELSVKKWGNFEVTGGPEYSVFKTSYSSLTNSILLEIESQKVRLNSPVQKVVHSTDSKCTTILMNGAKIKSNAVILTPSLGYLKKHYKSLIEPPLPLKQSNAIKNLGFGLINKVFIDFGEPWWEPGTKGFQLIWRRKVFDPDVPRWTKDLTGFDVLVGHKAVILGWVGGEGAYLVENESENQVAKDCCKVLEKFLRRNIPEVKKCIRTKWLANQYVLGSYSHISMKCDEANVQPEDLMEPVWSSVNGEKKPVLLIAGEAASKHYYSTTHGAYDTGTKQANVFLEHWTCPPFELPN